MTVRDCDLTAVGGVEPATRVRAVRAYVPPARRATRRPVLRLDANEGPGADSTVADAIGRLSADALRRYPSAAELEQRVARLWGAAAERVVVTNGGDDAIHRACMALLEPGREILIHEPTFEMISISARLAGAAVRAVDWMDGPFPTQQLLEAIGPTTRLVALVSPNNPTGLAIAMDDLVQVARTAQAQGAAVLVDLAYVEFADVDPTAALIELPNVIVVRTFSKARSLAGLRVGYAIAPEPMAAWLRAVGGPYAVSAVSLAGAGASLDAGSEPVDRCVSVVRGERARLMDLLIELGAAPIASSGNFVAARFGDAACVQRGLRSLGVSVRAFGDRGGLEDLLRITLPGCEADYARLERALRCVCAPEAVLFDLDGVLADVSRSYRAAIVQTARSFGVQVTAADVAAAKLGGHANNDWELTRRLLTDRGVDVTLERVVERFQSMYFGSDGSAGLRETESLLAPRGFLERLAKRYPLAIVTGRPREEAMWFLDREGIAECFTTVVSMEDAPAKPSPEPVRLALHRLGATRAWMVGDTPDDIDAAIDADVLPIAIPAAGEGGGETRAALEQCGAARVLNTLEQLEAMLP